MKFKPYNHSEAALNERIALIINEEKKKGHEKEALRTIFQSIDFTTLEAFDNEAKIKDFCDKALAFPKQKPHLSVPAICIPRGHGGLCLPLGHDALRPESQRGGVLRQRRCR